MGDVLNAFLTTNGLILLLTAGPFILMFMLLYIMSFSKDRSLYMREEFRNMAYVFLLIAILMVAGLSIFEFVIRHHLTKS